MKCRNKTALRLTLCASVLMMLSACQTMTYGSETEQAMCDAWGDSLFLPSRADTLETARGLNDAVAVYEAACEREFAR